MRYLLIVLLSLISFTASAQPFQVVASCGTVSNPGAIGSGMNGYIDTSGNICTNASASNLNGANASGAVVTATGTTTARTGADRAADLINVKDGYGGQTGAKGDGKLFNAGFGPVFPTFAMSAASTALSSNIALWSALDVGKSIVVANAGTPPTVGLPQTVTVSSPGLGYTSVPTCAVTDASGGGTGATCAALMSAVSATLVSGGSGCVNGATQEFIVSIDGAGSGTNVGTIPRVTGTVTAGALTGPLTISNAGLQTVLGTLTAAPAYGDNCTAPPTVTLSYGVGAVQMATLGPNRLVTATYSITQTTAALSGGSPSVAAVIGSVNVQAPTPPLISTIAAYTSPTQVTLAGPSIAAVSGAIPVLWATDDHVAFQNALSAGRGIWVPPGIYWNGANSLDPGSNGMIVMGAGRDSTTIMFDNGNSTTQDSPTPGAWTPWLKHVSGSANGGVTLQNFQIRGLLDFGRMAIGAAALELNKFVRITEDNMIFRQISYIANQNELVAEYNVLGTLFDTVNGDQARCRRCRAVSVIGNVFQHSDDDSVSIHQESNSVVTPPGFASEDVIVQGNVFEDTMCVHILGGRNVVVSGNTFDRCKIQAVNISWTPTSGEGQIQLRTLTVSDNVATNTINRIGSGPAFCVYCISFSGPTAPTSITSMYPGVPATINFVPKPWDYDLGNSVLGTEFAPAARGVNIHDNTAMRTRPAVANYSAWGYGPMFSPTGFIDPPIADSFMQPTSGITASVNSPDLRIHDNHVHDVRRGIVITDNSVIPGIIHVSITNNDIYNAWEYGVYGNGAGSFSSFDVLGNNIDLDPYLISPGRAGTNGSWTSGYAASVGVQVLYVGPVKLGMNTMQDMYQTQQPLPGWIVWKNVLKGSPFFTSGSTLQLTNWTSSNIGIGVYPNNVGDQFNIYPVATNPGTAPANYGLGLFSKSNISAAAPTSGFHVVGDFIASTAVQTCSCTGWVALNTGTTWTAGTDYKVVPIQ